MKATSQNPFNITSLCLVAIDRKPFVSIDLELQGRNYREGLSGFHTAGFMIKDYRNIVCGQCTRVTTNPNIKNKIKTPTKKITLQRECGIDRDFFYSVKSIVMIIEVVK